jgi:cytochrome oxidase Cu insertion factor (SCO1/SenC/PrrC family)
MFALPETTLGEHHQPIDEYNYAHYRAKHLLMNLWWTLRSRGIQPGQVAPDFELPSTDGERIRLRTLRGRPVVLRFGSFT